MDKAVIRAKSFSHFFGPVAALKNINLEVYQNEIFGIIGPAGSGKSTFLRALNRLNDLIPSSRPEGTLEVFGRDVYAPTPRVVELRRRRGRGVAAALPR